jgi:hypothetical protein
MTWAPSLFGQTAGGMSLVDSLGPQHFIARSGSRDKGFGAQPGVLQWCSATCMGAVLPSGTSCEDNN